jgi:hypothetical protein
MIFSPLGVTIGMLIILVVTRLIPFQITPKVIKKFPYGNKYLTYYKNFPRILYLLNEHKTTKMVNVKGVYTKDNSRDLWYHALIIEGYENNLDEIIDHKISPLLRILPNDASVSLLELLFTYKEKEGFVVLEFGIFEKGIVKQEQRKEKLKNLLG